MASNLSQISRYVLLSDAAYADFVSKNTGLPFNTETDKSDIAKALAARLSSQGKGKGDVANADAAQVQLVVQNYILVTHQPDTKSGFSATLFQDNKVKDNKKDVEYVLAIRGTSQRYQDLIATDIGDIVSDGLAVDQIVDMYNWWQQVSTAKDAHYQKAVLETDLALTAAYKAAERVGPLATQAFIEALGSEYLAVSELESAGVQIKKLKTVDSGEKGTGLVPTGTKLTVTGHSLGGHLAAAFERLFPANVKEAWMVNGAGFAGDSHPFVPRVTKNIAHLFTTLGGANDFNSTGVVNNIIGDKYLLAGNVVAMDKQWGLKQPGGKLDSFIETADVSTTLGHGVGQMTDSAAVVSLFTDMAKTTLGGLSMKEQFSYLNKILKEVATDDEKTLETIVHKLDVLFNGKGVKRITTGDRDKLFEHIEAVRTAIAGKEDYQKLTVHDISVYAGSAEALAAAAKDSLAVRYALEELNPFVVLGVDYS